jgi:hypothetical protein
MISFCAPLAQCFAAELSTQGDVTKLVIGGGYGMIPKTKDPATEPHNDPRILAMRALSPELDESLRDGAIHPEVSYEVFHVEIDSGRGPTFVERARTGTGWEWELFEKKEIPSPRIDANVGTSTLFWIGDVCEDDFRDQPRDSVSDDDESNCLGRRMILQGLKARPDLNGKVGRCGPWLAETGRYCVVVIHPNKNHKKRESLSVKPVNLKFANKVTQDDFIQQIQSGQAMGTATLVVGVWPRDGKCEMVSPLSCPKLTKDSYATICSDSYRGPLSGKAMAVLDYCYERKGNTINATRLSPGMMSRQGPLKTFEERCAKSEYYEKFVADVVAKDTARVAEWQKTILSQRNMDSWSEYVKLSIALDGMKGGPTREIVVSTQVSIAVR